MKSYRAVPLLLIASTFFWGPDAYFRKGAVQMSQDDEWVLCNTCDFPVWLVLNSSPGPAVVPRRKIYLFIQDVDFTEQNLQQVFTRLADNYPQPISLSITAFSSKDMLKKLIKIEETPTIVEFMNTPKGKEDRRKYYEGLYPPKKGVFQAYYFRSPDGEESFQYNPNPEIEKFITIKLKEKADENYKGNLDLDLKLAVRKGDILKVRELLAKGAYINSRDRQGYTPLMHAKDIRIVKLLLDWGAEVDAKNIYGVTSLLKAADSGEVNVLLTLLHSGANINSKDIYGYTALMVAAMNGHDEVVDILLRMGADTTTLNNLGKSAIVLAREKGHKEIIRRLEAAGMQK